jgi:hypothetical protein
MVQGCCSAESGRQRCWWPLARGKCFSLRFSHSNLSCPAKAKTVKFFVLRCRPGIVYSLQMGLLPKSVSGRKEIVSPYFGALELCLVRINSRSVTLPFPFPKKLMQGYLGLFPLLEVSPLMGGMTPAQATLESGLFDNPFPSNWSQDSFVLPTPLCVPSLYLKHGMCMLICVTMSLSPTGLQGHTWHHTSSIVATQWMLGP